MQLVRHRFFTFSALAAAGLVVVGFGLHVRQTIVSAPATDPELTRGTVPTVSPRFYRGSTSAVHLELAEFAAQSNGGSRFSLFPSPPIQKSTPVSADAATRARLAANYGKLPLQFETNKGQTDKRVKFLARGRGYTMFLTDKAEAVLCLSSPQRAPRTQRERLASRSLRPSRFKQPQSADKVSVVRMKLVNANPALKVTGGEELPGKVNYFLGNDPKKWRTNVATYEKVEYESVYPGIDLAYYGNQSGRLEHDFIVAPGGDSLAWSPTFDSSFHVFERMGEVTLE